MRSYYFLWMLVIAGLISTQAYSQTNSLRNFFLLHYSSHSGGFQHIPLPASTVDPNTYAPVIYNTEQNHSFTITSLPGSPATTITLFFDDIVELVTFESGISVTISQIRNDKYQVDIYLPASKEARTRAFSLIGTGALEREKGNISSQSHRFKPLFQKPQWRGKDKTSVAAEHWSHIIRYQGNVKSDLYSEQQAWLQQPTPSTTVVMVVISRDTSTTSGEEESSSSHHETNDPPPAPTPTPTPSPTSETNQENNDYPTLLEAANDHTLLCSDGVYGVFLCDCCGERTLALLSSIHPEVLKLVLSKSAEKAIKKTSKDKKDDPDASTGNGSSPVK